MWPESIQLMIRHARNQDMKGRRSEWFMQGGPERNDATRLFQAILKQIRYLELDRHKELQIAMELAVQLEERHCEVGRPEVSRWNRAFGIAEDELSVLAR